LVYGNVMMVTIEITMGVTHFDSLKLDGPVQEVSKYKI
jgi:hypothetical protein